MRRVCGRKGRRAPSPAFLLFHSERGGAAVQSDRWPGCLKPGLAGVGAGRGRGGTEVLVVQGDERAPSSLATVCKHGKEGAVTCTPSHGRPWSRHT